MMTDYKKMYAVLFNAITGALEHLDGKDMEAAEEILRKAQIETEKIYMETDSE